MVHTNKWNGRLISSLNVLFTVVYILAQCKQNSANDSTSFSSRIVPLSPSGSLKMLTYVFWLPYSRIYYMSKMCGWFLITVKCPNSNNAHIRLASFSFSDLLSQRNFHQIFQTLVTYNVGEFCDLSVDSVQNLCALPLIHIYVWHCILSIKCSSKRNCVTDIWINIKWARSITVFRTKQ